MSFISNNISKIKSELPAGVTLIAVSKTHSKESILEAYNTGHKVFGENKVQELVPKFEFLPKDIEWHLIGHLQTNKVKYIAPFISHIHSVDSLKLLTEINKRAEANNRVINCFLQIYIAQEDTKFGLSFEEAETLLLSREVADFKNIKIVGMMGMASNTENIGIIREEFSRLYQFFSASKKKYKTSNIDIMELSMGMSSDYKIAIEEGSTMVRIGSTIFGNRDYA
jgi:PLP dependent protein